jgi:putative transposase
LGLAGGPIPSRVDAHAKQQLLEVVDQACASGWTLKRICGVLELATNRVWHWRQRAAQGVERLEDEVTRAPVHAITPDEEVEILAVAEEFKAIDRSHRKLAHRGSYEGRVWVSPATFRRVLAAHEVDLPVPPPPPPRAPITPLPAWVKWQPNQIWMYDVTHFSRAGRAATAIQDLVSRKWLGTVLSVEETSTQIELAFSRALEDEGLIAAITDRLDGRIRPDRPDGTHTPVLLAWSDNGPQMTSTDTRSFMALHLIAQHFGRPYTPQDQAWIESLFGHTKTEAPYLTKIDDPNLLSTELEARRAFYNGVRLHAGIGYVTPNDEHEGRGHTIRAARRDGMARARQARLAYHRNRRDNQTP